jgi:D-alanyl-lipoteichoic acid acyltransferase DltB (MBOAT superfamily)
LVIVFAQYATLRLFARRKGWLPWLAFFTPIVALILVRYVPASVYSGLAGHAGLEWNGILALIGISYLAFRCSRLVFEVRSGSVLMPNLFEYFNFAFFLPTMPVGPINTYANYRQGFAGVQIAEGRAALRILIGFVKYQFLGTICNQLTYSGLILDDHPHPWMDLPVAMVFYYLYLYCNFSGFCDIAIGAAGLIGIPVRENFNNPFAARNVQDFWNRWHMTLSLYMRDMMFVPVSKWLGRLIGPANINHAIALTILLVFLLIGIWHGAGWNYAAFGAVHAVGVIVNHYYIIYLKRRLGRDGFKAYQANRGIHFAAVGATFIYIAISFFFFANSPADMRQIFLVLR